MSVGLYRHCRNAAVAAGINAVGPLIACTSETAPSVPIVVRKCSIALCAFPTPCGGKVGFTLVTRSPIWTRSSACVDSGPGCGGTKRNWCERITKAGVSETVSSGSCISFGGLPPDGAVTGKNETGTGASAGSYVAGFAFAAFEAGWATCVVGAAALGVDFGGSATALAGGAGAAVGGAGAAVGGVNVGAVFLAGWIGAGSTAGRCVECRSAELSDAPEFSAARGAVFSLDSFRAPAAASSVAVAESFVSCTGGGAGAVVAGCATLPSTAGA